MKHETIRSGKRKAVNLSIDTGIAAAAREAGVNFSRVTEDALRLAIKAQQEQRWREENADAIAAYSEWYERDGDPLDALRVR